MDYELFLRALVQLLILVFAAWGLAGLIVSFDCLRYGRSTLRGWWRGATYFGTRSPAHLRFD